MTNNPLLMLRERISTPDLKLLALLAERHELAMEVGLTKHQATLSPSPAHPRIRSAIAGCADRCRQTITALIVFYHPSVSTNYRRFGANPAISLYCSISLTKSAGTLYASLFLGLKDLTHIWQRANTPRAISINCGCQKFQDIFTQVETGQADYAILPIENTKSGSIN